MVRVVREKGDSESGSYEGALRGAKDSRVDDVNATAAGAGLDSTGWASVRECSIGDGEIRPIKARVSATPHSP